MAVRCHKTKHYRKSFPAPLSLSSPEQMQAQVICLKGAWLYGRVSIILTLSSPGLESYFLLLQEPDAGGQLALPQGCIKRQCPVLRS